MFMGSYCVSSACVRRLQWTVGTADAPADSMRVVPAAAMAAFLWHTRLPPLPSCFVLRVTGVNALLAGADRRLLKGQWQSMTASLS